MSRLSKIAALAVVVVLVVLASPAKAAPDAAPGAAPDAAPDTRTLDAITIEGEVSLPSVLFINARDQRRDIGFLHREFAEEREAATRLPTWVMYGPVGLFSPVPTLFWTTTILETNEDQNQPAVPAEEQ